MYSLSRATHTFTIRFCGEKYLFQKTKKPSINPPVSTGSRLLKPKKLKKTTPCSRYIMTYFHYDDHFADNVVSKWFNPDEEDADIAEVIKDELWKNPLQFYLDVVCRPT